jgi:hypothetical protein
VTTFGCHVSTHKSLHDSPHPVTQRRLRPWTVPSHSLSPNHGPTLPGPTRMTPHTRPTHVTDTRTSPASARRLRNALRSPHTARHCASQDFKRVPAQRQILPVTLGPSDPDSRSPRPERPFSLPRPDGTRPDPARPGSAPCLTTSSGPATLTSPGPLPAAAPWLPIRAVVAAVHLALWPREPLA